MEEGYEDSISEEDISGLVDRANKAESDNIKLNQAINTMAGESKDGNFLHHQLDTDTLLQNLKHFYAGDYEGYNDEGDKAWLKQTDTDLITFNDFGVSSIMEVISKYIDKNTILSYYQEERIYQIIGDLGDELILFILCNYEKLGMDTYFKKTKFKLIIVTTTHMIENAYRRAIDGKTLKEINQSRVVGQFGEINNASPVRVRKERFIDKIMR